MTFAERYGLVQYSAARGGGYQRLGPCELHDADEGYCGPDLVFDHCHLHGWIRGVICQNSNMSLAGPRGLETRLRAGVIQFGCRHTHRVQSSADRCSAYLRRIAAPWLRAAAYLANCPDCHIPELVVAYAELREGPLR